jgi:hypothetical protein
MAQTIAQQPMAPEATRIAVGLSDLAPGDVTGPPGQPGTPFGTPQAAPGAAPAGGFAAPPSFDQVHAQQTAAAAKPARKLPVPVRTLVLLGITLVAVVGLLLMGPGGSEEAAAPQAAAVQTGVPAPMGAAPGATGTTAGAAGATAPGAGAAQAGTGTPEATGAGTAAAGATPEAGATGATTPEAGTAAGAAATPGTTAVAAPPGTPTEARQAADLVISGRWAEALPRYEALATAHPEQPEYAQMVRILRSRLAAQCQGGRDGLGRPCSP